MSRPRDAAVRGLYRLGWSVAGRVPAPVLTGLAGVAARAAVRHPGRHVRTLRHNLAVATGAPVAPGLLRAAVASYLRTLAEVWALPVRTAALVGSVRTVNEDTLRAAAATTGVVVALPHSGNVDLAGAWACTSGLPVTTVAERLGTAEYAAFLAFRRRLGMEVLAHSDPGTLAELASAVRRGRVVCLVADRDLSGTGLPVRWRGHPVRVPGGPAVVARRTGAALVPAACAYSGPQMVLTVGPPVPHRPGQAGLVAMTQELADFFADHVARHPADWHLLQPFFGPVGEGGR